MRLSEPISIPRSLMLINPPSCSLLRLLMKAFPAVVAFFPPWSICCGNNLACLRFLLCSTFAFQAALPSDASTQQHTTFVCIPACVPPVRHSSEKPLAQIPGILSFSLLSTLHQFSKFIVFLCAQFTFFPFMFVFSDCLHSFS